MLQKFNNLTRKVLKNKISKRFFIDMKINGTVQLIVHTFAIENCNI